MSKAKLPPGSRRLIAILLCLLVANFSFAADLHALWAVKGKRNTVYLLGSMHLLPPSEQFPAVIDTAYGDARKLVMEIDMDDINPLDAQRSMMELGMLPAGETLSQKLGPEGAAKLNAYAEQLGIQSAMLQQFRPWFAAIMLTQFHFMKKGLDPQSGVEQRFVARSGADKKEILGLETLEEQLKLLANLPDPLQRQFLLQSISEMDQADKEIDNMLAAWRSGDEAALERLVLRGMKEFPELYGPLTVERNRRWIPRLEELLGEEQNTLVIVGALHLVGKDGVIDLLKTKGYKIEQR